MGKDMKLLLWYVLQRFKPDICHGFDSKICYRSGKLRRQPTCHENDNENFLLLCDKCHKENEDQLEEWTRLTHRFNK